MSDAVLLAKMLISLLALSGDRPLEVSWQRHERHPLAGVDPDQPDRVRARLDPELLVSMSTVGTGDEDRLRVATGPGGELVTGVHACELRDRAVEEEQRARGRRGRRDDHDRERRDQRSLQHRVDEPMQSEDGALQPVAWGSGGRIRRGPADSLPARTRTPIRRARGDPPPAARTRPPERPPR